MGLLPFAYNNINIKMLLTSIINSLSVKNTAYLIENSDSVNANVVSVSNQVESTKLAVKKVFIVISL